MTPADFKISQVEDYKCPDGSTCSGNDGTCCAIGGGTYGCCPYANAVCCADEENCCPQGMSCGSSSSDPCKSNIWGPVGVE